MRQLIDLNFCRLQYGFSDDAAALDWFDQRPLPDFRTFSPRFSPIDYLLDHHDVREANSHPVAHFLDFGFKEGRAVRWAQILRRYDRPEPIERTSAKIAFVIHIFYLDYAEYFASRIAGLDNLDCDIFISVSQEVFDNFADLIRNRLAGRLKKLEVVINKGRNFSPLAVTFASDLVDYDVVCHCHSKESRYSGRKQTEWADYLITAMIGSRDFVRRHVEMIASGSCDVVAPSPFRGIPPWASHSLSNGRWLGEFGRRLGLEIQEGFMAYPIGGMFWVSRKVVRAIAALGLTIEDFPVEPSSHDGEIHHALERLIGQLGGDRLAFFDQATGAYWDADAVVAAEITRFMPPVDLIEAASAYKVVSFDFFDTLCVRATGDEEWAKKRVDFVLGDDYRSVRNATEARLRASLPPGRDVALSEISEELSRQGYTRAYEAAALERSWDLGSLLPNLDVIPAYLAAIEDGKFVFIVSDTYYDSGIVREFLGRYDLPQPNALLVSSEIGARKDRGDMWPLLLGLVGFDPVLHVGDNVYSDIQQACDAGINTFYVSHWRNECLPFSGLSAELRDRLKTNSAFRPTRDIPEAVLAE